MTSIPLPCAQGREVGAVIALGHGEPWPAEQPDPAAVLRLGRDLHHGRKDAGGADQRRDALAVPSVRRDASTKWLLSPSAKRSYRTDA
ncbi:hypothetical protein ACFV8Z_14390 [Streptomyces sp. NPDC059837]|uniref:hypothetical protein n=1 Tax=unclassified Streptomyces TaxID=2593676 RepID=UPI003664686D